MKELRKPLLTLNVVPPLLIDSISIGLRSVISSLLLFVVFALTFAISISILLGSGGGGGTGPLEIFLEGGVGADEGGGGGGGGGKEGAGVTEGGGGRDGADLCTGGAVDDVFGDVIGVLNRVGGNGGALLV